MIDYFISINCEDKLNNQLNREKTEIYAKYGNQQYLLDPPHITLYVGKTKDITKIYEGVKSFVNNNKIKKLNSKIIDWLIFENDKITNKTGIALKFDKKTIENLQALQSNLLQELITKKAIYKNKLELNKRYINVKFSKVESDCLNKFGYPFVGKNWLPHFSLCTVEIELKRKILEDINITKFINNYSLIAIEIYELINDKPLKKYEIKLK